MFCNMTVFYDELLGPCPSPKLDDHPLSAACDLFWVHYVLSADKDLFTWVSLNVWGVLAVWVSDLGVWELGIFNAKFRLTSLWNWNKCLLIMKNTIIPQFMSFGIYEMHSLIFGFKFASQFSLWAHSCHKLSVVPSTSSQPSVSVSFQKAQSTTSLSDLCRSITLSIIVLIALLWRWMFWAFDILHLLNLNEFLCIILVPNYSDTSANEFFGWWRFFRCFSDSANECFNGCAR